LPAAAAAAGAVAAAAGTAAAGTAPPADPPLRAAERQLLQLFRAHLQPAREQLLRFRQAMQQVTQQQAGSDKLVGFWADYEVSWLGGIPCGVGWNRGWGVSKSQPSGWADRLVDGKRGSSCCCPCTVLPLTAAPHINLVMHTTNGGCFSCSLPFCCCVAVCLLLCCAVPCSVGADGCV
jgi:hypothetical protein